jgi:hypothetical protein
MDKEQVKAALLEIDAQKAILEAKRKEILDAYCLTAPFKKGDKVSVFGKRNGELLGIGIINSVSPPKYSNSLDFEYDICKTKKDGTPSLVRFMSYDIKIIEKHG